MVDVQTAIGVGVVFALFLGLAILLAIHFAIPMDGSAPLGSKRRKEHIKRLLRDDDGFPSLARIQFFSWTVVILFCFAWIYFVRLANGVLVAPAAVPTDILALMGISAGATVASVGVSNLPSYKANRDAYANKTDLDRKEAAANAKAAAKVSNDAQKKASDLAGELVRAKEEEANATIAAQEGAANPADANVRTEAAARANAAASKKEADHAKAVAEAQTRAQEAAAAQKKATSIGEDSWGTMFLEHGSASLGRVQMFAWTVLSLAIYSVLVAMTMINLWGAGSAKALALPDIDTSLLVLMGISQAGYLGSKVAVGTAAQPAAPPAAQPLSCAASGTPRKGPAPLIVKFEATADGGAPQYTFAWDFGDRQAGTGTPVSHTYQDPGSYTVAATVTDSKTATARAASFRVSVSKSPSAAALNPLPAPPAPVPAVPALAPTAPTSVVTG